MAAPPTARRALAVGRARVGRLLSHGRDLAGRARSAVRAARGSAPRSSGEEPERVDVVFVVTTVRTVPFLEPVVEGLQAGGVRCGLVTNLSAGAPPGGRRRDFDWEADLPLRRAPAPLADLRHLVQLWRLLRVVRPSVVAASTPKGGMIGVVAARLAGVPAVVYQVRGFRAEQATGVSGRVQWSLEWLTLRLAHHRLFNSASLCRAMAAAGLPTAAAVVLGRGSSTGVDCERFALRPMRTVDATPVVGFLGRLHRDKGVDDLLRAFRRVRVEVPGAELLLVGEVDPAEPAVDALLGAVRAEPGVRYVPGTDDVPATMARFHCLALPTMREGLPNVALEAQACGRPVVGYAATGVVDAVDDGVGGILVPVGDVEGLAAAIASLLADLPAAARLGTQGRRFVEEHFRQDEVVARHVRFYAALLDRRPAS